MYQLGGPVNQNIDPTLAGPFQNEPINPATGQQAPLAPPAPAAPSYTSAPGGYTAPAPDPYAKWGGQAAYNSMLQGYRDQNQNILDFEKGPALSSASVGLNQGILDTVANATKAQNAVNADANQNYLSKVQGTRGVLDMVSQGLHSGGIQLANKGASNSSAGEALARAYSMLGRSQLSNVGNQFAQGQNKVNLEQQNADSDLATGIRHNQDAKVQAINSIVADANQKLQYLDAIMTSAAMPDRFNIAQEQQQVKDQAIAALQHFDSDLANQTGAIKPTDENARMLAGRNLALAGTAPDNAFQYSDVAPAQFQGTGPFAANLPIFTLPSAKKQPA